MRAAAITVSTSKAAAPGGDESGPRLVALIESLGGEVVVQEIVSDEVALIERCLAQCADEHRCELVLTSGGTGLGPRDVTPEATLAIVERQAPGIAEALRFDSRRHTPHAILSRGVAGTRGSTLIVNLPGAPRSIDEAGETLRGTLPHALALLRGEHPAH
jgi:molybdopterin adenylyltransferase